MSTSGVHLNIQQFKQGHKMENDDKPVDFGGTLYSDKPKRSKIAVSIPSILTKIDGVSQRPSGSQWLRGQYLFHNPRQTKENLQGNFGHPDRNGWVFPGFFSWCLALRRPIRRCLCQRLIRTAGDPAVISAPKGLISEKRGISADHSRPSDRGWHDCLYFPMIFLMFI